MSETQRRYSVYDRELLAIYTAVKHFRRLIEGGDVTVFTDHKPLACALSRPPSTTDTPRRERQLHFISQFCTSIKYIQGEANPVADALSRIEDIQCPSNIDYTELASDQEKDPVLKQLRQQSNLTFTDVTMPGISRPITCETSTGTPRPYLPTTYRFAAFKAQHGLCHPGVKCTRKQMCSKFFWPNMNKEVIHWTRACIDCQRSKIHRHVVTPLSDFPRSARFEHAHIDIIGPMRLSNGFRYCVTMIDRCTKWPEVVPVYEITAEIIAKVFYENWIARFGCPLRISTDQGRQFESSLFRSLMMKFGITRIRTTAYHAQSNGQIERLHRTLKAALMARGATTQWAEELPSVLLGLRTALRTNNNLSPAMMTYGTTLRLPSDFILPAKTNINDNDYVRRLAETMASIKTAPQSHNCRTQPFIHKDLATCTHVFVRNDAVRPPLTPPYDGPYEVIKRYDKYYKIKLPLRTSVISLDRLKPAYILNESEETADHATLDKTTRPCTHPSQTYTTRSGRNVKPVVRFA